MNAHWVKYPLKFKTPAKTSRDTLQQRDTWFIIIEDNGKFGIGEAGIIPGLSIDHPDKIEAALTRCCHDIAVYSAGDYEDFPSVQFAMETALRSLEGNDPFILYQSDFVNGLSSIEINGLVWMGDESYMKNQIIDKIDRGFKCIKLKVGALDFDTELSLLRYIRTTFNEVDIELRVDVNGAFSVGDAPDKLRSLSAFNIHSIEQPIKAGQIDQMRQLCTTSHIPIALDEELIGISEEEMEPLLTTIHPQYIVLKPSLLGGIDKTEKWISLADKLGIKWWVTSALESNIGLNAIAQWVSTKDSLLPQGLGTGQLYSNNIDSPLHLESDQMRYMKTKKWDINQIVSWTAIS